MIALKHIITIFFFAAFGWASAQVDFLVDYDGPTISTTHKTITLSDYYNADYARLSVSQVELGYNTLPQGDPKYTVKNRKYYDEEGYLIAQIEYDSQQHLKTSLGTFERPVQRTYSYSTDHHEIVEVSFVKLGNRIDTTYVTSLVFDDHERLVKRFTQSHQTDYKREFLYAYDSLGNCLKESWGLKNSFVSISYQYQYDKKGNILREIMNENDSYTRTFSYDSLYRLVEVTSSTDTVQLNYDETNNVSFIQFSKSSEEGQVEWKEFDLYCQSGNYSFEYNEQQQLVARDFYCSDGKKGFIVSRSQPPLKLKYYYLENGLIVEVKQHETTLPNSSKDLKTQPYFNFSYSYKYGGKE